ncbi:uncharacterized protein LOC110983662 [Acanthaster planci]|uniref:Uncharacterized protein LOC110983662 n=1 Tax=Acanthaster planci TaxID=133434 RepID=A0A8B7YZK6_ACAPL|nr:uncharacterized protein LOC110983662 [Acanthaster planci]
MFSFGVMILVAVVTTASLQTAEGVSSCNCTRTHPQQHYCTANYVVRGRVVLIQWQLIPDLQTDPTTVTETQTNLTAYMTTNPPTQGPEGTQNVETTAEDDDKSTAFPSSHGQDHEAMPAHRQDDQRASRREKRLLRNRIVNQEPWNYEIVYIIKIQHMYKNVARSSLIEGEEMELKTPYPGRGYCGVELRAGKSYLLAGVVAGQVNLCDWVQEYRHVSKLQKRGLKNNYGQSCSKCQIMTCHDPECTGTLPPSTCAYLPPHEEEDDMRHEIGYRDNDCLARHSRCYSKGRKADKCVWTTSGDMKSCRRQSRRN